MNVFIETSIVNNVLDLEESRPSDTTGQENSEYLKLLLSGPVATGEMIFYVNPSVRWQINNTKDEQHKEGLLAKLSEFEFTELNLTIFPFHFPAKFISKEQSALIDELCKDHPALFRDKKIIADAAFNEYINVLLTTDKNLAHQVCQLGKVKFMLPKELWDSYQTTH